MSRHPAPSRRSSLTRQLVLPVVGLLLAAVLANVGFAAWLAARRSGRAVSQRQEQVAAALRSSRIPLTQPVLDTLERLTGCHFVVWDDASRTHGLSTLPPESIAATGDERLAAAVPAGTLTVDGQRYRIGAIRSRGVRPETVLVLAPVRPLFAATMEAVWPVLAVAAATIAALVPLGLRTTGRLAARIGAIERHVGRIATGDLGQAAGMLAAAAGRGTVEPADEIDRLVAGVDRMTATLGDLRTSLVAGERQRLLGQLAAGFAHELRNAVTGARLAIDLHRRRCPGEAAAPDESLAVALRQLDILEEEVRGLLALGRPPETETAPVSVDRLLDEVRELTAPRCEHAAVRLECATPTGITVTGRRDPLRAALVNLALNGIDAAGRGGLVRLVGQTRGDRVVLAVEDTGPGPPESIRDTLHEPFVTGKPEGIGLGLAVAKAVAEEHGGRLEWERADGRTRFEIRLPSATLAAHRQPREPSA